MVGVFSNEEVEFDDLSCVFRMSFCFGGEVVVAGVFINEEVEFTATSEMVELVFEDKFPRMMPSIPETIFESKRRLKFRGLVDDDFEFRCEEKYSRIHFLSCSE